MKSATGPGAALLILGAAAMVFPHRSGAQEDFRASGVPFGIEAHKSKCCR